MLYQEIINEWTFKFFHRNTKCQRQNNTSRQKQLGLHEITLESLYLILRRFTNQDVPPLNI